MRHLDQFLAFLVAIETRLSLWQKSMFYGTTVSCLQMIFKSRCACIDCVPKPGYNNNKSVHLFCWFLFFLRGRGHVVQKNMVSWMGTSRHVYTERQWRVCKIASHITIDFLIHQTSHSKTGCNPRLILSLSVVTVPILTFSVNGSLWLISTNGDGFGSLRRGSIPKIRTVTIRKTLCTGIRIRIRTSGKSFE